MNVIEDVIRCNFWDYDLNTVPEYYQDNVDAIEQFKYQVLEVDSENEVEDLLWDCMDRIKVC